MKGRTNNPNGRPPGVPNRITREMRDRLKAIFDAELDRLPQMLESLPDDRRLEVLLRMMPYVVPKVEAVRASYGEPDSIFSFD